MDRRGSTNDVSLKSTTWVVSTRTWCIEPSEVELNRTFYVNRTIDEAATVRTTAVESLNTLAST
jgi:hypothetical protein